MKVGDLVKWTHPLAKDTGIILSFVNDGFKDHHAIIHWFGKPECSGMYLVDHELLELLDEGR